MGLLADSFKGHTKLQAYSRISFIKLSYEFNAVKIFLRNDSPFCFLVNKTLSVRDLVGYF